MRKFICGDRNPNLVASGLGRVTKKKCEQTFRGDSNAPYLNFGDNIDVSICQNLSNCTLKFHAF